MDENLQKFKQVISENLYAVISTATNEGEPWVSPVYFNYDENFNIFWESSKDAKHSGLVRENPRIAIAIFNSAAHEGTGTGIYLEARAHEVEESELPEVIEKFYGGRHPNVADTKAKKIEDYIGDKPLRMYRAVPKRAFVLTDGKRVDGYYVDEKEEVAFKQHA